MNFLRFFILLIPVFKSGLNVHFSGGTVGLVLC